MKIVTTVLAATALLVGSGVSAIAIAKPSHAQGGAVVTNAPMVRAVEIRDTFQNSSRGWNAIFADYTESGDRAEYGMEFSVRNLPAPLDTATRGLYLAGHNRSDDLAMFVTKQLTPTHGIRANTMYRIDFDFQIATDAAVDAFGIGGGPGVSVHVKAGAVGTRPRVALQDDGSYRANFDHGQQMADGTSVIKVGDLAKPTGSDDSRYELKKFDNVGKPVYASSNDRGQIWLLVGTDSGYEGNTRIYFPSVHAVLTPIQAG